MRQVNRIFLLALLSTIFLVQMAVAATIEEGCFGTVTVYVDELKTVTSNFDEYTESIADNFRWSSSEEKLISDTHYSNNNYYFRIANEDNNKCVIIGMSPTSSDQQLYCHLNYKGTRYIGYYNVRVLSLGELTVNQRREGNVVYLSCPEFPDANMYYYLGDFRAALGDDLWGQWWIYDGNSSKPKNGIVYPSTGIVLPDVNGEVEIWGFASKPKYEHGTSGGYIWETAYEEKACDINETNFPDENFRNYLLSQDYGRDKTLTKQEIEKVETLNVSRMEIRSLKGVEYFSSLRRLDCKNNLLESLDVSKNLKLQELNCLRNPLGKIDVSKNISLQVLTCGYTLLTQLDVSQNYDLTELHCNGNVLTALNVENNPKLTYLSCFGNQIHSSAMDALIASLPTYTDGERHRFLVYHATYGDDGNVCTKRQVTTLKAKGWTPEYNDGTAWMEYEGSEDEEPALKGDVNGDGEVSGTDYVALTNMILGKTEKKSAGDVNGDGQVSGTDYVTLVNIILGKK